MADNVGKTNTADYRGYRFSPDFIAHAVWLHHQSIPRLRDIGELLGVRSTTLSYETIRQWCRTLQNHRNGKFGFNRNGGNRLGLIGGQGQNRTADTRIFSPCVCLRRPFKSMGYQGRSLPRLHNSAQRCTTHPRKTPPVDLAHARLTMDRGDGLQTKGRMLTGWYG